MNITPYVQDAMVGKICPYCKSETKKITSIDFYGVPYGGDRMIICCKNYPHCDSYVGTHKDGLSLGRLANSLLRQYKIRAHECFDPIWKEKYLTRQEAYKELGEFLDIPEEYTHIGMFNISTCKKVIEWSNDIMQIVTKP